MGGKVGGLRDREVEKVRRSRKSSVNVGKELSECG